MESKPSASSLKTCGEYSSSAYSCFHSDKYEHDPESLRTAGLAYAVDQTSICDPDSRDPFISMNNAVASHFHL